MTPSELKAKGLAVKPLEWTAGHSKTSFDAPSILGMWGGWLTSYNEWTYSEPSGVGHGPYPSPDAAKAAAQADYESRICAALTEVK